MASEEKMGIWRGLMNMTTIKRKQLFPNFSSSKLMLYILLITIGFFMIFPFLLMLTTSLKDIQQVFAYPPRWIPNPFVWENYINIWKAAPFGRYFLNSAIMVIGIFIGQITVSSLAAYAFTRLKFKGRDMVFLLYLAMMMVPFQVRLIPMFIICNFLGLTNSYGALIVPRIFNTFPIFLLRQFFLSIPKEMDESAIIDGANHFQILIHVILPNTKAVMSALGVWLFMTYWNDLLWPLIATSGDSMRVVTNGLTAFSDLYGTNWPLLMTGSLLMILPVLTVYIFNQKFITKGMVMTGLKG